MKKSKDIRYNLLLLSGKIVLPNGTSGHTQ